MKTKTRAAMYRQGILLAAVLSLVPASTLWAMTTEEATPPPRPSIPIMQASYGKLPLSFEANQGQWDPAVQFVTRGRGHQLFLTPSEAVLSVRTGEAKAEGRADHTARHKVLPSSSTTSDSVVRMKFEGADSQAEMVGLEPLPGIVNYFIGDDPSKWYTNIPTYQKVGYKDLYPGIDLVYYGNQGQLEYDLVVAPGADPTQIMLAFDGAEQLTVDDQGDLVLTLPQSSTEAGQAETATLRLHKPVVYQRDEQGEKHALAGTYVLRGAETAATHHTVAVHLGETQHVAFQVASYDTSKPLIIDPVLSWATYLGRSGDDGGGGIAIDVSGNAYVTGGTSSSGFPGTAGSPIQSTFGGNRDVFVAKLNAAGTALLYSTYLGGNGKDDGFGIAVDAAGNAYVTGDTRSSDFPGTAGSLIQSMYGGGDYDAFVTKLNANGTSILYSTYLGGGNDDYGYGVVIDQAGQAYVTGQSGGPGFPATIPNTCRGNSDAFVTKLNAAGTSLVYSTCLGSSDTETATAIAIDEEGNAYVTGVAGVGFPGTTGSPIQGTYGGGPTDAFVTKLNASGTAILYSTYLGGSGRDGGFGIAVDAAGYAYITGHTSSTGFPGTAGSSLQPTLGGNLDAFVTKLNASGTAILYSTYLGGSAEDSGFGIAVDQAGHAYVTGESASSNFPGTAGSPIQSTYGGDPTDGFVTKLNATGTALLYSNYLGGSGRDSGRGIAVDTVGNAHVTGETYGGFPGISSSPIQGTYGGGGDAFVAKITSRIIINDLVTFEPLAPTYRTTTNPTGCPAGFVGTFSFDARLTAKDSRGSHDHSDLAVKVTTLSNGNLLHNADGGNGGVGSTLTVPYTSGYADGTLDPGESVDITFSLCLKANTPFTFFVDVLGTH